MTALYVFGAFLVLLLLGAVLAPLVEREPPDEELEDLPPAERREAAVEVLAEVEFEYRTDKLPEEEYRRLRTRYGRIALAAEKEMEGDGGPDGQALGSGDRGAAAADEAQRAPGSGDDARRGEEAAGVGSDSPDAGPGDGTSPHTCTGCGDRVPEGARFCPGCGERLQGER